MDKNNAVPKCVMSVHAHPDDQEFTVAGTLAYWAGCGTRVVSVIVTSGEAGSNDPSRDGGYKSTLAGIREKEQLAACAILGIKDTIFLHYPDGELEPTMQLRREITRVMRTFKPDTLVIGDPQGVFYGSGYINHPDHRAAAQAALYAGFPSSETRLIFTDLLDEGLEPHKISQVFIHGAEVSDTWIDIAASIDLKISALRCHASQLGDWDPEKMIREWAAEEGKKQGLQYAEVFKVMHLDEQG